MITLLKSHRLFSPRSSLLNLLNQNLSSMKTFLLCFTLGAFIVSCNSKVESASATDSTAVASSNTAPADLPYTASYSSSWTQDVSDADLKTVLLSYKNWADGNISELSKQMGDTVEVDMSNGNHLKKSNADLMKFWTTSRDSMSSVKIDMSAWNKMYSTDKKTAFVVTWYDETDTYKSGKVDSASYQDINMMKDGKIVYYSQYKRPKK